MKTKLKLFQDALNKMDRDDLEIMLIELAWKETTIEHLVDSVVTDHLEDVQR